jgi:hypothetical protein
VAHLYFEVPLPRLFDMTTAEFLQMCSDFLAAAVKEDHDRETDEAARQYAVKRFGFDPGDPEFGSLGAW